MRCRGAHHAAHFRPFFFMSHVNMVSIEDGWGFVCRGGMLTFEALIF